LEPNKQLLTAETTLDVFCRSFEAMPIPVLFQYENGDIFHSNESASSYFGYPKANLIKMSVMDLCPWTDPQRLAYEWGEITGSGKLVFCDRHKCADGVIKHATITKTYVNIDDSKFAVVAVENISPLKQQSDEIQFLYNIMDMSNDAIFVVRASDDVIVYANEKACSGLGYEKSFLEGSPLGLVQTSSNNAVLNKYVEFFKQNNSSMLYRIFRRSDASVFPAEISYKYFVKDGINYGIAVARDITERVHYLQETELKNEQLSEKNRQLAVQIAERTRKLQTTEARYEKYVNNAPNPIFFIDKEGHYTDVNEAMCNLAGRTREELIARSVFTNLPEESMYGAKEAFNTLLAEGKSTFSLKYEKQNKEVFYINISAAEVEEGVYMCVCKDVTRSRILEEALHKLNAELSERVREEVALRQKQEGFIFEQKKLKDMALLINAIAHQWRQPINALILYIQDIIDTYEAGELDKDYIKSFESVSKDLVIHMSKTIDDFRTFFAPNKKPQRFNITGEIVKLSQLLRIQLYERKVSCRIFCACDGQQSDCTDGVEPHDCPSKRMEVYGFLDEFKQALINIIYNAVDSIEDNIARGNITKGLIRFDIENKVGSITIKVTDNGTGISEENLSKVFDPYYTTKEEGKGTGIGLYMAKMVIERHNGGKITVANGEERGAVFEISIPTDSECELVRATLQ
jgi:PAS domain S-box-containing protein